MSALNSTKPSSYSLPRLSALLLVSAFVLGTLTLWVQAYWPVAFFETFAFLSAGTALISGKRPAYKTRTPLFVLSFIAFWGCLQLLIGSTAYGFETERAAWQWATWLAVYYAGICIFEDKWLRRMIFHGIVWFGFAVAVEAIVQAYLSPGKVFGLFPTNYHEFVMGPIIYHTHFAAIIETIFPLSLYLAFSNSKKRYTFIGVSATLLSAVVVSASRGGLIIVLAEVFVVVALMRIRKVVSARQTVMLSLTFVSAVVILALIVGFGTISQRFRSETLIHGRHEFAISSLHMIAAHPWIGSGLGSWPAVYPAFASHDYGAMVNQAHCDWLQWIAEGGLPVGIAMLILLSWTVKPAFKSIWGIGVIAVLAHATFDYPFSRPVVGAWPILLLSLVAKSQTTTKPAKQGQES